MALRSFMVATTPRTGGNWLDHVLGLAGLGAPDEYLRILDRDGALSYLAIRQLWREHTANDIFGIKVHWDEQWKWHLPINFGALLPPGPQSYVYLVREDKDAQAKSLATALEFGTWFVHADEDLVPDPDSVRECKAVVAAMDRNWERWWRRNRIRPLRISYEEMVADMDGIIEAIRDLIQGEDVMDLARQKVTNV